MTIFLNILQKLFCNIMFRAALLLLCYVLFAVIVILALPYLTILAIRASRPLLSDLKQQCVRLWAWWDLHMPTL